MKINIVSKDKRYIKVNELLLQKGYDSFICSYDQVDKCDCLILPLGNELSETELKAVLINLHPNTLVLSGNKTIIQKHFSGNVIDYSLDEEFLQKNAFLTAEAAISYLHSITNETLSGKQILVTGYGRIAKELCRLLKAIGACVFVYARREEIREKIIKNGYAAVTLDKCKICDIIVNTVPSVILSNRLINSIPNEAYLVDLASMPYGFETMERVHLGSGLPGKFLPASAAKIVFDTVIQALSKTGKDNL